MQEAAATNDVERQQALRDIAKMCTQTADNMESVSSQDNEQFPEGNGRILASGGKGNSRAQAHRFWRDSMAA